jgi:hypothetical protein
LKNLIIVAIFTVITSLLFAFETDQEALQHVKDVEFDLQPQDILLSVIEKYDRQAAGYGRHDALTILNYNSLLNDSFGYHHLSADWLDFSGMSWGLDFKYLENGPRNMLAGHGIMISYKEHFWDYFDDFNIMLKIMNPAPLFLIAWGFDAVGQEDYIIDGISGALLSYVKGTDLENWLDNFYNNSLSLGIAEMQDPFKLYENPQPEDLAEIYFMDVINYDFLRLRHFSMGLGYSYSALLEPLVESFVSYDDGFDTKVYGGDINSIFRSFYFDLNVINITSDLLGLKFIENLTNLFDTRLLAFVERTVRKYDVTSLGVKLFSFPLIGNTIKFDGKVQTNRFAGGGEENLIQGRLALNPSKLYLAAELSLSSPTYEDWLYNYGLYLDMDLRYSLGGILEASVKMFNSPELVPTEINDLEISVSMIFER